MSTVETELLRSLITGLFTLRISRTRTFLCLCMPRKKDGKIKPITPEDSKKIRVYRYPDFRVHPDLLVAILEDDAPQTVRNSLCVINSTATTVTSRPWFALRMHKKNFMQFCSLIDTKRKYCDPWRELRRIYCPRLLFGKQAQIFRECHGPRATTESRTWSYLWTIHTSSNLST
ncbi:hypothetical protein P692DRAFT_20530943 [Suillus brevipes Sb2]|nr:hypothetical protein P692DRAFT_20530943 [Suillus brevipes Sb2]